MAISNEEQQLKQLKIKTGVVKRISKEHGLYKEQVKKEEKTVKNLEEQFKDLEHLLAKNGQIVEETAKMIDFSKKSVQKAALELEALMGEVEFDSASDDVSGANSFLAMAQQYMAEKTPQQPALTKAPSTEQKLKELKIKANVLQRLIKEHEAYKLQVTQEEQKVSALQEELKNAGYPLKLAREIEQESTNMVRYTFGALRKAVLELEELVAQIQMKGDSEEILEARRHLEGASVFYKKPVVV